MSVRLVLGGKIEYVEYKKSQKEFVQNL